MLAGCMCAGWLFNYDNDLMKRRCFSQLWEFIRKAESLVSIYPILVQKMAGIPVDLYISLLSAVLAAWMAAVGFDLYRNRKGMKMGKKEMTFERGPVLLRSLPMMLFILYSFAICFIS